MNWKCMVTGFVLFTLPMAVQAGEGWFSHHHCPKPSYNRWNYLLPKVGYEWRAYLHPAPADYRTGPYPHHGADVPGVRRFPCPPVAPEVLYPPPAHPPVYDRNAVPGTQAPPADGRPRTNGYPRE